MPPAMAALAAAQGPGRTLLGLLLFVSVVVLHRQVGGNLVSLLDRVATYTRDRNLFRGQFQAATALGRVLPDLGQSNRRAAGSTDMGNVSLAVPSIHPAIGIDSLPAVNHQPEFAAHCVTPAADLALTDGAVALAWTAIDCATDETIRARLLSH